jgi:hypothetical protein
MLDWDWKSGTVTQTYETNRNGENPNIYAVVIPPHKPYCVHFPEKMKHRRKYFMKDVRSEFSNYKRKVGVKWCVDEKSILLNFLK